VILARPRRAGGRSGGPPAPFAPDRPAATGDTLESAGVGAPGEALGARLRAQFPQADRADGRLLLVSALLRIENRPSALQRLLQVWAAEVSEAAATGDFTAVKAWLGILSSHRASSEEEADLVKGAVCSALRPEVLEGLAWRFTTEGGAGCGVRLPEGLGEPLVRYLVEGLAESGFTRRRQLVDLLAALGRVDIRLVASCAADASPAQLRGLTAALGRTGRPEAIPVLESLAAHSSRRVRVAALAGLTVLRGSEAVPALASALDDAEYLVRASCLSLLRTCPGSEAVGALLGFLGTGKPSLPEATKAVQTILERSGSEVPFELGRLARRPGPVGQAISSLQGSGAW
jgi:hypothetical protein